jgi:uncharacterized protein (DUF1330 family)
MPAVDPTGADLKQFLAEDDGMPVTMLNLLKFKPNGGRDRYDSYATAIGPFLKQVGGHVVYFGATSTPLVAPPGDTSWDAVLLVTYPSRRAFSEMVANPEYQQITHLRTEALDAAVLQPTVTRG